MVRLRVVLDGMKFFAKQNFNSNMVRLRVRMFFGGSDTDIFQFQYGAIKRLVKQWEENKHKLFQFQYGAIKSQNDIQELENNKVFQFQYGAIKRAFSDKLSGGSPTFQFQYGAIKS